MKFWNKDKEVRRTHWTRVVKPTKRHTNQELKRWCQLQTSRGRFYYYYGSDTWWFERPDDATFFLLKWS